MIGDFRFQCSPAEQDIVLKLFWRDGARMAHLDIPDDVDNALAIEELPGSRDMSLPSALGYAVFVAGQSGRRLSLTGDKTVWIEAWGHLLDGKTSH